MCPAKSKAQQRLFGIARAVQKGDRPASSVSDPAKMIAKTVKKREVDKFAKTSTKGLPDRVKKEMKEAIKELVSEILNEEPKPNTDPQKAYDMYKKASVSKEGPLSYDEWYKTVWANKNEALVKETPESKKYQQNQMISAARKKAQSDPTKAYAQYKTQVKDKTKIKSYDDWYNTWKEPVEEARTIGTANRNALKRTVITMWKKDHDVTEDEIIDSLPSEWWDTWEMADQEIRRIVWDTLMKLEHGQNESVNGTAGNLANQYPIDKCTACSGKGYTQAFGGGAADTCKVCGGKGYVHSKKPVKESQLARLQEKLGRELSVPEKHQLAIAYKTVKMPDAMVGVMGGMTVQQAKDIIKKLTGHEYKERTNEVHPSVLAAEKTETEGDKVALEMNKKHAPPQTIIDKLKQMGFDEEHAKTICYRNQNVGESITEAQITYVAIYNGKEIEINNATSLYDAKKKAIERLRVPASKQQMISVMPAEKDGEPITHVATEGKEYPIEVYDERPTKTLSIIMMRKGNENRAAIFKKGKENKYNRNNPKDVAKLWALAKKYPQQVIPEGESAHCLNCGSQLKRDSKGISYCPKCDYNPGERETKKKKEGFKIDTGVPVKEQYKINPELSWLKKLIQKRKYQVGPVSIILAFDPRSKKLGINAMMIVNQSHPLEDAPRHIEAALDGITGLKDTVFKLDQIAPHIEKKSGASLQKLWLLPAGKISTWGGQTEEKRPAKKPDLNKLRDKIQAKHGYSHADMYNLSQKKLKSLLKAPARKESVNEAVTRTAKQLMTIDSKIWDRLGVHSGSQLKTKWEQYKKLLGAVLKGITPVDQSTLLKLENENYHSLMQALGQLGLVDPKAPYYKSLTREE